MPLHTPMLRGGVSVIVGLETERDNLDSNSHGTVIQVSCAVLEPILSMKS